MENNQYLDVLITLTKSKFKAICPLFPSCKGIGDTKQDAIERLGRSISNYIAKVSKESFKRLFKESNSKELLIDPFNKKSMQHHLYNLDVEQNPLQKNVLLNFSPILQATDDPSKKEEDAHAFLKGLFPFRSEQHPPFFNTKHASAEDTDYICGFPIHLN